ncbi:amidohydrolase domain-containing protein [Ditylenchus destructor]|uniref:2-amino-3-carboxymuconate-6-semialdehyde decarboxylase n=1 Tax=Ditylenchus destructor TaxID=166010 RepID=A0AAD4QY16_9BILA|nr:amidohydrolase domain-containing protein [Ditylenchus destructor]
MKVSASSHRKIDVHTHVLPRNIPDFSQKFGYGGFITLNHNEDTGVSSMMKNGTLFRNVEKNCFDFETRLDEMEKCKVNVQAVSTVPVMFHYWAKAEHAEYTSRFLNDDLAGNCRKYPSKFISLGTLPMQNTELAVKVGLTTN